MASPPVEWLRCFRCGWVWRPRRAGVRICPRCKSPKWNVPELRPAPPGRGLGIRDLPPDLRQRIAAICARRGARHVRVFGSFARRAATTTSDLDLLVAFDPGRTLFDHVRLQFELEAALGRPVDVVPENGLRPLVRPQVVFEAVPL